MHDFNDERYPVTANADHVAATTPQEDRDDDAAAINEAGGRAATDNVRLEGLTDDPYWFG